LSHKYGRQFASDFAFTKHINDAFTFKQAIDAHVINFGHLNLESLFEVAVSKEKAEARGGETFLKNDKGQCLKMTKRHLQAQEESLSNTSLLISFKLKVGKDFLEYVATKPSRQ
jgi:hypothetical protein